MPNTASESRYSLPATNRWVVTGKCPGAEGLLILRAVRRFGVKDIPVQSEVLVRKHAFESDFGGVGHLGIECIVDAQHTVRACHRSQARLIETAAAEAPVPAAVEGPIVVGLVALHSSACRKGRAR
jgi:hypothetical protein